MPRKIKDESGAEVEVFDKTELDAAALAAAEAKAKELEPEINPNWREARKTMDDLKRENERLAKGEKPTPTTASPDDVQRIANESAQRAIVEDRRDQSLESYGEKRADVAKMFEKLTAGETVTKENVGTFVQQAANAVGARRTANPDVGARFGREGNEPKFEQGKKEGFGDTDAGKATAAAMQIPIEEPKKT